MEINLIDNVRTTCRAVVQKADHIRINEDLICSYTHSLPLRNAISPELDAHVHYLGHAEDTLAFFLILDSINFGSGYFPYLQKRSGMSGYFTIASSLNDYFKNRGPFSARQLHDLTVEDCAKIFNQDLNNGPVKELMRLFSQALNDLGRYLLEDFNGRFGDLVSAANASVIRLVELLTKMPYFNDVEPYKNLKVTFYKRAQLAAADLALAFGGTGWGYFSDLDQLTIFADNLVPHVLRIDNILIYEKSLLNRINGGELIPAGSKEEIEIRACAVHAVELLKQNLQKAGHRINSSGLDYLLWNRGQQPHYKAIPRHRTRTVFY